MGFDLYGNTTVLDFTGTRYKGAEVRVRSDVSIEEYLAFLESADADSEWEWFRANVLIGWNLEKNGEALSMELPRKSLPGPLIKKIINGWQTTFVEIDLPLVEPSDSGESSVGQ